MYHKGKVAWKGTTQVAVEVLIVESNIVDDRPLPGFWVFPRACDRPDSRDPR